MLALKRAILVSAVAASAMATAAPSRLPFVSDDYAKARAEARKSKVPIFVEVWAPW